MRHTKFDNFTPPKTRQLLAFVMAFSLIFGNALPAYADSDDSSESTEIVCEEVMGDSTSNASDEAEEKEKEDVDSGNSAKGESTKKLDVLDVQSDSDDNSSDDNALTDNQNEDADDVNNTSEDDNEKEDRDDQNTDECTDSNAESDTETGNSTDEQVPPASEKDESGRDGEKSDEQKDPEDAPASVEPVEEVIEDLSPVPDDKPAPENDEKNDTELEIKPDDNHEDSSEDNDEDSDDEQDIDYADDEDGQDSWSDASGILPENDNGYYPVFQSVKLSEEMRLHNLTNHMTQVHPTSYAVCNSDGWVGVHDGKGTECDIVGELHKGDVCYILADEDDAWVYVESGYVRGFVFSYYLDRIEGELSSTVSVSASANTHTAEQVMSPLDNVAFKYVMKTTMEPVQHYELPDYPNLSEERQAIIDYAESFVGNEYVWGGDDPHSGVDCSGFTKYVYNHFDVNLPRVSAEQSQVGMKINVEDALPGDLIFFSDNGIVHHVAMSTGGANTVEARGCAYGIVNAAVGHRNACWAMRVIRDDIELNEDERNGDVIIPYEACGGVYTYERFDRTDWGTGTGQRRFHDEFECYDDEGFARLNDRYVVAVAPYWGKVGDLINFHMSDGTVFEVVVQDIKARDPGMDGLGHNHNKNVIEFLVNGYSDAAPVKWHATHHENPGSPGFYEEWAGLTVDYAVNLGSVWSDDTPTADA